MIIIIDQISKINNKLINICLKVEALSRIWANNAKTETQALKIIIKITRREIEAHKE